MQYLSPSLHLTELTVNIFTVDFNLNFVCTKTLAFHKKWLLSSKTVLFTTATAETAFSTKLSETLFIFHWIKTEILKYLTEKWIVSAWKYTFWNNEQEII